MSSPRTPASSTRSTACGEAPSASSPRKPTSGRVRSAFATLTDAVLAVALGAECAACRRPLDHPSRGAICAECWAALCLFVPPLCGRCGLPLPSEPAVVAPGEPDGCPACAGVDSAIDLARAIGPHEGVLRDAVHALKYRGLVSVATPLAARLRAAGAEALCGADAVVPVPLHPAREWRRGFNQAEQLAKGLGLPVLPVLCRVQSTSPQTGLGARARRRNLRGAFAVARFPGARGAARWLNLLPWRGLRRTRSRIAGRVLVLVDDVATTGATLEACARVLRAAGAREVRAITAARAVRAPR